MKTLVLIDDSADQIELMELALESLDPRPPVRTFNSGEDCIVAVERGGLQPGLIMLDVNMPGLDGPATAARIRALPQGRLAPIVMMSTSDQPADVRRAREAGADSYVMKPMGRRTWNDVMAGITGYWFGLDLGTRS